jgi:hypothetical protein
MNTDYNKQAIDFLNATSTRFKADFKKHDFYFPNDKEQRDIYRITLKNKLHTYRFNFGQSIANTGTAPRPYDVLACLQKYEVGTFENFCDDFGYDTDSRSAYKIYKAVMKEWKNVELLFTPEQIEELQEIS